MQSRLLGYLYLAQTAVLQVEGQVHHVTEVIVTADIGLCKESTTVHLHSLENSATDKIKCGRGWSTIVFKGNFNLPWI